MGEILGDSVLVSAILDRLLHHFNAINKAGKSYKTNDIIENYILSYFKRYGEFMMHSEELLNGENTKKYFKKEKKHEKFRTSKLYINI